MLRIIDHHWHIAHAYRLHALPVRFDFFPVGNRYWEEEIRPFPPNFGGDVLHPHMAEYDVILSHFDNWCDRSQLRATPFRIMNLLAQEAPGTPRITIMHGTPDNEDNRAAIQRMLDLAPGGSPFMVVNSEQAFQDWGLGPERSRAIIHGYDVDEFWSSKEKQLWAVTVCSAGTISREYHGVSMLEAVKRHAPVLWCGKNGDIDYFKTYQEYREFLACSLIYVHTGQRSPMPGARTEAMLSGCCIVTTSNQDAWRYIEHGVTGFLCDTAQEMADTINSLLADPQRAYRIGQAGREAAQANFHRDRYIFDWLKLLQDLGVAV